MKRSSLVLAVAVLSFVACGTFARAAAPKDYSQISIGFAGMTLNNEFHITLANGAKEKAKELTFENMSGYTVAVIPLTIEWGGFSLAPGQRMKLKDIDNPDFRYEPSERVQEGSASTERYIVFVDAPPSEGI